MGSRVRQGIGAVLAIAATFATGGLAAGLAGAAFAFQISGARAAQKEQKRKAELAQRIAAAAIKDTQATVRGGVQPAMAVYGEACIGGVMQDYNTFKQTANEVESYSSVVVTGHAYDPYPHSSNQLSGIFFNDDYLPWDATHWDRIGGHELTATTGGNGAPKGTYRPRNWGKRYSEGGTNDADSLIRVRWSKGNRDGGPSVSVANIPEWTSADVGRNILWTELHYIQRGGLDESQNSNGVLGDGLPVIRTVWKYMRCFDPRKALDNVVFLAQANKPETPNPTVSTTPGGNWRATVASAKSAGTGNVVWCSFRYRVGNRTHYMQPFQIGSDEAYTVARANRHILTDESTWEWTDNPILQLIHYQYVLSSRNWNHKTDPFARRVWWNTAAEAADNCDEFVPIPGGTEKRWRCDVAVILGTEPDTDRRNEDVIKASCLMEVVETGGKLAYSVPSAAPTANRITIDQSMIVGAVSGSSNAPVEDRFNTIPAFSFASRDHKYRVVNSPMRQNAADVAKEGELRQAMVAHGVTRNTQCQRLMNILLKQQETLHETINLPLNWKGYRLAPDVVFDLEFPDLFQGKKAFRVESMSIDVGNVRNPLSVLAREDEGDVYDDLPAAQYNTLAADGTQSFGDNTPFPVKALRAEGVNGAISLTWNNPTYYDEIVVFSSTDNQWDNAEQVWAGDADSFVHQTRVQRWYWVRVLLNGLDSLRLPNDDVSHITATPVFTEPSPPHRLNVFSYNRLLTSSTASLANGSYRFFVGSRSNTNLTGTTWGRITQATILELSEKDSRGLPVLTLQDLTDEDWVMLEVAEDQFVTFNITATPVKITNGYRLAVSEFTQTLQTANDIASTTAAVNFMFSDERRARQPGVINYRYDFQDDTIDNHGQNGHYSFFSASSPTLANIIGLGTGKFVDAVNAKLLIVSLADLNGNNSDAWSKLDPDNNDRIIYQQQDNQWVEFEITSKNTRQISSNPYFEFGLNVLSYDARGGIDLPSAQGVTDILFYLSQWAPLPVSFVDLDLPAISQKVSADSPFDVTATLSGPGVAAANWAWEKRGTGIDTIVRKTPTNTGATDTATVTLADITSDQKPGINVIARMPSNGLVRADFEEFDYIAGARFTVTLNVSSTQAAPGSTVAVSFVIGGMDTTGTPTYSLTASNGTLSDDDAQTANLTMPESGDVVLNGEVTKNGITVAADPVTIRVASFSGEILGPDTIAESGSVNLFVGDFRGDLATAAKTYAWTTPSGTLSATNTNFVTLTATSVGDAVSVQCVVTAGGTSVTLRKTLRVVSASDVESAVFLSASVNEINALSSSRTVTFTGTFSNPNTVSDVYLQRFRRVRGDWGDFGSPQPATTATNRQNFTHTFPVNSSVSRTEWRLRYKENANDVVYKFSNNIVIVDVLRNTVSAMGALSVSMTDVENVAGKSVTPMSAMVENASGMVSYGWAAGTGSFTPTNTQDVRYRPGTAGDAFDGVSVTATDSKGNSATASQIITIDAGAEPTIALVSNASVINRAVTFSPAVSLTALFNPSPFDLVNIQHKRPGETEWRTLMSFSNGTSPLTHPYAFTEDDENGTHLFRTEARVGETGNFLYSLETPVMLEQRAVFMIDFEPSVETLDLRLSQSVTLSAVYSSPNLLNSIQAERLVSGAWVGQGTAAANQRSPYSYEHTFGQSEAVGVDSWRGKYKVGENDEFSFTPPAMVQLVRTVDPGTPPLGASGALFEFPNTLRPIGRNNDDYYFAGRNRPNRHSISVYDSAGNFQANKSFALSTSDVNNDSRIWVAGGKLYTGLPRPGNNLGSVVVYSLTNRSRESVISVPTGTQTWDGVQYTAGTGNLMPYIASVLQNKIIAHNWHGPRHPESPFYVLSFSRGPSPVVNGAFFVNVAGGPFDPVVYDDNFNLWGRRTDDAGVYEMPRLSPGFSRILRNHAVLFSIRTIYLVDANFVDSQFVYFTGRPTFPPSRTEDDTRPFTLYRYTLDYNIFRIEASSSMTTIARGSSLPVTLIYQPADPSLNAAQPQTQAPGSSVWTDVGTLQSNAPIPYTTNVAFASDAAVGVWKVRFKYRRGATGNFLSTNSLDITVT